MLRTLFEVKGHLNYALADKKGRLFTDTINQTIFCSSPAEFATYHYANGQLTTIFTDMITTMGLAIDYKRNKFYHGDACQYQIVELDYDCKTGDICKYKIILYSKVNSCVFNEFPFFNTKGNGRVVYNFKNSGITPYPLILGLNVGQNGLLYCTTYESGLLFIIDPV